MWNRAGDTQTFHQHGDTQTFHEHGDTQTFHEHGVHVFFFSMYVVDNGRSLSIL